MKGQFPEFWNLGRFDFRAVGRFDRFSDVDAFFLLVKIFVGTDKSLERCDR